MAYTLRLPILAGLIALAALSAGPGASPASAVSVQQVSAGAFHTCALTTDGGVKCWGRNASGQLGDGTKTDRLTPVDVAGLTSGVTAIALGFNHSCAITDAGALRCWGYNFWGQLGDGTTGDQDEPQDVIGLASGVTDVDAGGSHTCALTAGGGVKCWGYNLYGQVGDGTTLQHPENLTPADVTGLAGGVADVAVGENHSCAVTEVGALKCWGYNVRGQIGDGTTTNRPTPVDVSGLGGGVITADGGANHTCALLDTADAQCWGANDGGQLGDGTMEDRLAPVEVAGLGSAVAVLDAGFDHTCAVTTEGGAKCWGNNFWGQLGDGTAANSATPVDVTGLGSGVAGVSPWFRHSCASLAGGGAMCWGNNSNGQLGDGTTTDSFTPVAVQLDPLDGDGDGVPDVDDNCPNVSNGGQEDIDGDAAGDACDPDTDGDGYWDAHETAKGSDPMDPGSMPERCDGADNDGDTVTDEPPALSGRAAPDPLCDPGADPDGDTVTNASDTDDDGDGFSDEDEEYMAVDALASCPAGDGHDAWPPDADANGTTNVGDLVSLFGGGKILQDAGDPFYSARSDVDASGAVNIGDLVGFFGGGVMLTSC